MEGRVNYTVVGVFVLTLCAILFAAIFWMGSMNHGKVYHGYVVYMEEDVAGLSEESPVRFNGVKVGYVDSITLDPKNAQLVKILLMIEPDVAIRTNTFAVLVPQGVTGVVTVNLKSLAATGPLLQVQPGQQYPVIPSRPSLLNRVSTFLPMLANSLDKLTTSVSQAFNDQNLAALHASLQNIQVLTKSLADNSNNFTQTMQNINHASENISQASNHLPQAMASFDQTMQGAQGLVRHLSTQVLPGLEQTMTSLSATSQNVSGLTEELQRNPSMLIRGKQPTRPGPGEK